MSLNKLPPHEWIIISLLVLTLSLLSFVTLVGKKEVIPPTKTVTHLSLEMIQVTIKGAVTHAGTFELKKGAYVKDILAMALPLPEADLSKLKPVSYTHLRDHETDSYLVCRLL